ncbi:hypothetical protein D9M71_587960 [compost metagenome]
MPGRRSLQPVAVGGEALVTDRAMGAWQVIQEHFATVLFVAGLGCVGGNGKQPGLEARALLESLEVTYHRQPGVLYRFVGMPAADNRVGDGAHGALIGVDQFLERLLLTLEQPLQQAGLLFASHRHPSIVLRVESD